MNLKRFGPSLVIGLGLVLAFAFSCNAAAVADHLDLGQYCETLNEKLAQQPYALSYGNPQEMLAHAFGLLHFYPNLTYSQDRLNLAKAWRKIVLDEPIEEDTLALVSAVADCAPERFESMKTLTNATKQYVYRWITPEFLSNEIKNATTRRDSTSAANNFITSSFLHDYLANMPKGNNTIHLNELAGSDTCCKHVYAAVPVVQLMRNRSALLYQETGYQMNYRSGYNKGYVSNKKELSRYLIDRMFKACESYVAEARKVMHAIQGVGKYFMEGEKNMIHFLLQDAQNSIVRYKLCSDLVDNPENQQKLVDLVAKELNFET